MDLITVLVSILIVLFLALIWKCTAKYGYLESLGIPVIKPFLFLGSPPFALHKIQWVDFYQKQHQKYGMTYGSYTGTYAIIHTIDPEIIKAVYVKNFEELGDMIDNPNFEDKMKTIDLAQGKDWKNLRKIMSPTFTSGKLKAMMEPMADIADQAMEFLESKSDTPIGMKKFFQGYALDTICRCGFSIETNCHADQDSPIANAGREAFQGFVINNWLESIFTTFLYFFPGLEAKFPSLLYPEAFFKLQEIIDDIIEKRQKSSEKHHDFIDKIIQVANDPKSPVSQDMIFAQGKIFFAAGFETTSNCLATLCYNLALNPDVQEKVYQEVLEALEKHEKIDQECIQDLPYLEATLNENLRLYSPIIVQDRVCKKDVEVKGLLIKKGTYIQMPIQAAHLHEEFFPEPHKFKPERFLNNEMLPYTFRAFSGGPRVCLGQRFALIEMKIGMAKLLQKFKIDTCPETKLELKPGDQFILNYEEIYLKLTPRQ